MANLKIPIYDVSIDDEQIGLTAISFVDEPAIMTDFVAFRNAEQHIWMSSHDKREIVSPILIPNQLIYRETKEGEPYYIRWTEKAIKNAAAKYLANGFWNNFTVMHPTFYNQDMTYEDALEKDVYMLRMWIIEDEAKDDANTKYGFHMPKGTLMVHLKVHNRQIWNRIKSGELRGLSIEALTNVIRTNNDVNINMKMQKIDFTHKQMNLFQKFIQFMNEISSEAAEIADIAKNDATDSGEVSLKYYVDDEHYIEVDAEGYARDEESNLVAEGEYKLADGNVLIVDADNKFVETKAVADVETEEPVEAPIAEKMEKADDEKDEEDDENAEGEASGDTGDVESEGDVEGTPEDTEAPAEEGGETPEEVPAEEPVEEIPSTLVPFEINGEEFMLPQPVVDYINSLKGEGDEVKAQLMQIKERMPSATPIPSVISQSSVEKNEDNIDLFDAVRLLNQKR